MNYFELYDVAPSLHVDAAMLRRKYLLLSKQYHPDFFDASLGITQDENLKLSAQVNEGYKLMQHKQQLLGYVLEQNGIITPDEKYQLDPEFLMEMMDLNEDWDDATSPEKIRQLEIELDNIVETQYSKALEAFTAADWQALKDYFYKRKYLRRLYDRSEGREVEM